MVTITKDDRIFSGFGSVAVTDRQGDFIPIQEFSNVMKVLVERGAPVIDSHSNHSVGKIIAYDFRKDKDGKDGLYLTAQIYRNYPSDDEVWQAIKENRYTGFSLGGKAGSKTPVCDENGCYNLLKDIEAWEFSIVETPANQNALIDSVNKLAKSYKCYKSYPIVKYVQQCGDEWCVYSESGKRLGTHGSQEDAYKQLYAIEVNKSFGALSKHDMQVLRYFENGSIAIGEIQSSGLISSLKVLMNFGLVEQNNKTYTLTSKGERFIDTNVYKAKVYVKTPQDAPPGVKLEQGPKGGHYYESSAKAPKIEQHGLKPYNPEQLKAKILTDFKRRSPGQGIEKSIESEDEMKIILQETKYGLVSAGKNPNNEADRNLTPEQIQQRHLSLKQELIKRGYVFTPVVGNYGEMEDSFLVMMHDAEEQEVVEIGRAFNQDSVIFVEKGHNSMIYTTGEKAGKRLRGDGWQPLPKEQKEYYTQVNLKGGFFKFALNFNWEQLLEKIMKAKVYIKNPQQAPKGVKVETGPQGGHYYESEDISGHTSEELSNIQSIVNEPMNIDEPQREIGSKEYLPTLNRYIEENLKTPKGIQKLRSLNLENTLAGIDLNTNFANLMIEDQSPNIRWKAAHRADMEHLYKLVNDKEAIIRQKVAERIDQNGLHIMMHNENEPNIGVRNRIAQRIDLTGLEYIIDKWDDYESQNIANNRFPYVRFLTPMIDTFNKTGKIDIPDQLISYINDIIKYNSNSKILIETTDEFYNLYGNGKYNEFHLESKSDWEQSSSSNYALLLKDSVKRQFGGEIRYHDAVKDMQARIRELQRKYPQELVDNYVKIQKQLTRAYLDVMFPDMNEITIYRGTEKREVEGITTPYENIDTQQLIEEWKKITGPKEALMPWLDRKTQEKKALVKSNSLSSWTLKKEVADTFARAGAKSGIVLISKVSKDDIWSTFMSHAYMGNEREILTIGKDRIVDLQNVATEPTPQEDPMGELES